MDRIWGRREVFSSRLLLRISYLFVIAMLVVNFYVTLVINFINLEIVVIKTMKTSNTILSCVRNRLYGITDKSIIANV